MPHLDHIVCTVPDLDKAMKFFRDVLGCLPIYGGQHESLGTHNAIIGLGNKKDKQYLELLAINPEDPKYPRNEYRFNLSCDITTPVVSGFAIQCEHIRDTAKALAFFGEEYDHGEVKSMTRETPIGDLLSWEIAYLEEQHQASLGLIPFLIDWKAGKHPTNNLVEANFCDFEFKVFHPEAEITHDKFRSVGIEDIVVEYSDEPGFVLILRRNDKQLKIFADQQLMAHYTQRPANQKK